MRVFKNSFRVFLLFLLSVCSLWSQEECTIAVVSGKATVDGRPLLWKNRDVTDQDNVVRFIRGTKYSFIGIAPAGEYDVVLAGINSAGFAVLNSVSRDLEGSSGDDNGAIMTRALGECACVDDFEQLLRSTNNEGRLTLANFGVIDSKGNCAIFETGNTSYTKFDAKDSPQGFVVRTNYAITGIHPEKGGGYERYERANQLFQQAASSYSISHKFILRKAARDLVNEGINPYPLPFEGSQNDHPLGYIHTYYSISRFTTASCVVFHGVLAEEDPCLSTMWCILGEPVCSVGLPVWVCTQSVPYILEGDYTAPLRDAAKLKEALCYTDPTSDRYLDTYQLVDEDGEGIFSFTFQIEDWIFAETNSVLDVWRDVLPTENQVKNFEEEISSQAFYHFITSTVPTDIKAPLQFTGEKVLNRGLAIFEYINVLYWQANPDNENIVRYRIYQLDGEKKFLLEANYADAFRDGDGYRYWDRNVERENQYTYALVAVNDENKEGNPVCTTVK